GIEHLRPINGQNAIVAADVEGVQRSADDAQRLRPGVIEVERESASLLQPCDLQTVVVGEANVVVHGDGVVTIAIAPAANCAAGIWAVIRYVVRRSIIRVARRCLASDWVSLE